jgi:hypothetical protein
MKWAYTGETKKYGALTLRRVRYGRKLGGWIEHDGNLSQEGEAIVSDNAMVFGNAKVSGDAMVVNNAMVFGNAEVFDSARVYSNAKVFGNARLHGDAIARDYARVFGNADISGDVHVNDFALANGNLMLDCREQLCKSKPVKGMKEFKVTFYYRTSQKREVKALSEENAIYKALLNEQKYFYPKGMVFKRASELDTIILCEAEDRE